MYKVELIAAIESAAQTMLKPARATAERLTLEENERIFKERSEARALEILTGEGFSNIRARAMLLVRVSYDDKSSFMLTSFYQCRSSMASSFPSETASQMAKLGKRKKQDREANIGTYTVQAVTFLESHGYTVKKRSDF